MKNYLSVGLVSATLLLLQALEKYRCNDVRQLAEIHIIYGINQKSALNFALQCHWITVEQNKVNITDTGKQILLQFNGKCLEDVLWREILNDYIIYSKPSWSRLIPAGRKETFLFMTADEKRCFLEANLMSIPASDVIISWWDSLANKIRGISQSNLENIGRIGEKLTLQYEYKRTLCEPIWESVESNLIGYDIISQRSNVNDENILIEVKSSCKSMQDASMIISKNEWEVAWNGYNRSRYYVYAWLLDNRPQLAILSTQEIHKNIPIEQGNGKWTSVEIPFKNFSNKFQYVNLAN